MASFSRFISGNVGARSTCSRFATVNSRSNPIVAMPHDSRRSRHFRLVNHYHLLSTSHTACLKLDDHYSHWCQIALLTPGLVGNYATLQQEPITLDMNYIQGSTDCNNSKLNPYDNYSCLISLGVIITLLLNKSCKSNVALRTVIAIIHAE